MPSDPRTVILLGATGTIGRAVLSELQAQDVRVKCLGRAVCHKTPFKGTEWHRVDFRDPHSISEAMRNTKADAVISCLASRTGSASDAWDIDYKAHSNVLRATGAAGIGQFVHLSAICVQKPLLEFQRAKLAFESELQAAGLLWSIVRPTAFFKSLSGQVKRVQAGKPFLLFGDGTLTACKPISDRDLARYIVGCLESPERWRRILPIGGPGLALTPLAQGEMLFDLLGRPLRYRHVPVGLMDGIIALTSALGRVSPALARKAEFARIGRYYATESMLVWDAEAQAYDAAATPSFGTDTLRDHYAALLRGEAEVDLGQHAVF